MSSIPKISVNKLGEYLDANPTRRKKIVYDQKYPSPFIATRYNRARNIAIDFCVSGFNPEIIEQGIETIESSSWDTDYQESDNNKSIAYLEKLMDMDFSHFDGFTIVKYNGSNPKLSIEGLDVSVNPDLIVKGICKGQKVVGAIKLHISQNNQLDSEAAKNVATLIHQFVSDSLLEPDEVADIKLCTSIDAFSGLIESAPKSYVRRRKNLSDACMEIVLWWDSL